MLDWFKKSSDKAGDRSRRDRESEPLPFRPAKLPPRRPDPARPATTQTGTIPVATTSSSIQFKHAEFTFQLGGDWVSIPTQSQEQFIWESSATNSSVVVSLMPLDIPQEGLVDVANKVLEAREQAERDARAGQKFHFGDKWVELKPSGDMAEVAYAGLDESGMVFRFFGFVTRRKVLSLWVATKTRDNDFSKRIFDQAFRGLKFYVP